jgi:hypothetical protein
MSDTFPSPPVPEPVPPPASLKPVTLPPWKHWQVWLWPLLLLVGVELTVKIFSMWHQWVSKGRPHGTEKPLPAMVWEIVTLGVVASLAAAGDIALLNRLRGNKRYCRWYFRVSISIFKRVLLLLQLAAIGAALYYLGIHYLGIKVVDWVPGPAAAPA